MMFSLSVVESWMIVLICSLSGVVLVCSWIWFLIAVSRLVYGFKVFAFLFLGCWYVFYCSLVVLECQVGCVVFCFFILVCSGCVSGGDCFSDSYYTIYIYCTYYTYYT